MRCILQISLFVNWSLRLAEARCGARLCEPQPRPHFEMPPFIAHAFVNSNGVPSLSPGLGRAAGLPWVIRKIISNPNGVASFLMVA